MLNGGLNVDMEPLVTPRHVASSDGQRKHKAKWITKPESIIECTVRMVHYLIAKQILNIP